MRHVHLADAVDLGAAADRIGRRRFFAAAVEREHGRAFERRREEGAGGVRSMVLDEVPARRGPVGAARAKRDCRWCGAPLARCRGALTIDERNSGSQAASHSSAIG